MKAPGAEPVPADAAFALDPPLNPMAYQPPEPVRWCAPRSYSRRAVGTDLPPQATHAVVVNLDYKAEAVVGLRSAHPVEVFDPASSNWTRVAGEAGRTPSARAAANSCEHALDAAQPDFIGAVDNMDCWSTRVRRH